MKIWSAIIVLLLSLPALRAEDFGDEWGELQVQQDPQNTDAEEKAPAETAQEPAAEAPAQKEEPPQKAEEKAVEEPAQEETVQEKEAPAEEKPAMAEEEPAAPEAPAAKMAEEPAKAADGPVHTVVEGDTLWDLADSFYKDPFNWPAIWNANKGAIQDPDLIYPNQEFVIPGAAGSSRTAFNPSKPSKTAGKKAPEMAEGQESPSAAEEPSQAQAPADSENAEEPEASVEAEPVPLKIVKSISSRRKGESLELGSYIATKDWATSGRIVGERTSKLMISQGDTIYINIGTSAGLQPRMRGNILRRGKLVKDPDSGDTLGYAVDRVGQFEVTREITDKTATALVIYSQDPIRVGDYVLLQ